MIVTILGMWHSLVNHVRTGAGVRVCLRRATGAASPHPEDHYIRAVHRLGMPYAIISDIHANLEALDVVLADIAARQPDAVVCLGDFVGYGPDPVACVERVRSQLRAAVLGNHDVAALEARDTVAAKFNPFAYEAVVWTRRQLTDPVRRYLEGLPLRATLDTALCVHGSVRDPIEEYIFDVPPPGRVSMRHLLRSALLATRTSPLCSRRRGRPSSVSRCCPASLSGCSPTGVTSSTLAVSGNLGTATRARRTCGWTPLSRSRRWSGSSILFLRRSRRCWQPACPRCWRNGWLSEDNSVTRDS